MGSVQLEESRQEQVGGLQMVSGFVKRDGTNGTTNLAVTGRTTLPKWAATFTRFFQSAGEVRWSYLAT